MTVRSAPAARHVVLVLGDQLDRQSSALDGFDRGRDRVLMVESAAEARHVWSHKARIAVFLAAMRHHAAWLRQQGYPVDYVRTDGTLAAAVAEHGRALSAARIVTTEPGEWRVREALREACAAAGLRLEIRLDTHFLVTAAEFGEWARGRRELRMEHFYRVMRAKTGVLMDHGKPVGSRWNFDAANREAFGRGGPGAVPRRRGFAPDAVTAAVLDEVRREYASHPGSLEAFDWPVTRERALDALGDFIANRLTGFGRWQDAMWTDEPFLYHSTLSAALNLKLLHPREVIDAAAASDAAPLAAREGFIRQVLGWREFIRGVYWLDMPGLDDANHFGHGNPLPAWYWTGKTGMACLAAAIGQTLRHGYAHHIQRLMLTGMFGVLAELSPKAVSDWYLAVYVDAVEWAEHPNVLGMALFANGGRFTSKPYVASGAYVKRMSNYCAGCRYDPAQRTGERACPLTALYWRFLDRHERRFAAAPRTALMAKHLQRMKPAERAAIRRWGDRLLGRLDAL